MGTVPHHVLRVSMRSAKWLLSPSLSDWGGALRQLMDPGMETSCLGCSRV